jgi:hypothetical protein
MSDVFAAMAAMALAGVVLMGYVVFAFLCFAWFTLFPAIGVLYLLGFLN